MRRYPRTEKYDSAWISENWMGPNPLWLLEELCGHMDLKPGMRILDMGCGKGITSIFLAKEYGVTVSANDLWISSADNLKRFNESYLGRYLGEKIIEEFTDKVLRLMEDGVFSRTEFRRIFISTHDAKFVEAMFSP